METTVDIEALRNDIIREVLATEDLGLLEWIREKMDRVKAGEKREELKPYTREELDARIDRAEAEEAHGIPGVEWHTFVEELEEEFPWLRG